MTDTQRKTKWRIRLFHLYFLFARPMTLGVRAIVHDAAAGTVFLVRHTYVPGWQLPGGGVENGESADEALARELDEEGHIRLTGPARLLSFHFNRRASRRDHVALYLVEAFEQTRPRQRDREIAEAGFFPLDALPPETTQATRERLDEAFGGRVSSPYW
ncbi:DNA mismatch repair protein MutT [Zhengella mangrovi]|uniref:DNA mismatch repair protein MutT n=1 Tax=Zhengella mangrovi TaxID=1982044 RepID=A0A2G1QP79_9HYPH|nr:NUDIX domain-containing protein [Zhengella mangrovi]PHP67336.1 DNA mismatch repair protein MutT [Zhengella mangrovi]